jgi:DNA gyrase/topoisomerase IV subunit A
MSEMFEKATRKSLRFVTDIGRLAVEDLWDLPLTIRGNGASLDNIAKGLNKALRESNEESFVVKNTTKNSLLELKFDIVKHIIAVKLEDAEKAKKAADTRVKKEKILSVMASKEDDALSEKSVDELRNMLNDL